MSRVYHMYVHAQINYEKYNRAIKSRRLIYGDIWKENVKKISPSQLTRVNYLLEFAKILFFLKGTNYFVSMYYLRTNQTSISTCEKEVSLYQDSLVELTQPCTWTGQVFNKYEIWNIIYINFSHVVTHECRIWIY